MAKTQAKMKSTRKNREKVARVVIEKMKVFKDNDKRLKVKEFDSASGHDRRELISNSWVATSYRVDDIFAKDAERNPADSLEDFVKTLFQLAGNRPLVAALKLMI